MYAQEFNVLGIYESQSVYENGAAIMPLAADAAADGPARQSTGFVVQVDDPTDPRAVRGSRRAD